MTELSQFCFGDRYHQRVHLGAQLGDVSQALAVVNMCPAVFLPAPQSQQDGTFFSLRRFSVLSLLIGVVTLLFAPYSHLRPTPRFSIRHFPPLRFGGKLNREAGPPPLIPLTIPPGFFAHLSTL